MYKAFVCFYIDCLTLSGIECDSVSAMARNEAEIFETATEGARHPLGLALGTGLPCRLLFTVEPNATTRCGRAQLASLHAKVRLSGEGSIMT